MEGIGRYYLITLFVLGAIVAGCASPGTSRANYTPPTADQYDDNENEIVVKESFDTVWDRLVRRLSSSFFVINNIDKESRLINVTFSSSTPEDYIDCGASTREFTFKNENRTYSYETAEDSSFKMSAPWGAYQNLTAVYTVHRDSNLDGRINVYVAPAGSNTTTVSVNVRYIFSLESSGSVIGYNAFGTPQVNETIPSETSTVSFNTGQLGSETWGVGEHTEEVKCTSKSVLENKLLDMAR